MRKLVVLVALLAMAVGVVNVVAAGDCDIANEPEGICLYEAYSFPKGSLGEGIISLSYVIPGKLVKEKGLRGVWTEVVEKVLGRYIAKDRQGEMSSYLISIISYPYEDAPAIMAEDELDRNFLELLILMNARQI